MNWRPVSLKMSHYVCCCVPSRKENTEKQSLTACAEDGRRVGDGCDESKKSHAVLSDTSSQSSDANQSSPATRSLSETTTPSSVTSINHDLCSEDHQCSPDSSLQVCDTSLDEQHASLTASSSAVDEENTESSAQEEIDMSTTTVTSALDFDAEIVPSAATSSADDEDCGESDDTCERITYKSQHGEEAHRMNPLQSSLRTISKSEVTTVQ